MKHLDQWVENKKNENTNKFLYFNSVTTNIAIIYKTILLFTSLCDDIIIKCLILSEIARYLEK